MKPLISLIFFAITVNLIQLTNAYLVDDNPYRHFVTLDSNGKYQLEWLVDWNQKRITFNVTVKTTGYVGLGLIRRAGKMTGADIVIGGVYPNGRSYFSDRHAIANQLPELDPEQNWDLHSSWERGGRTFLSFSRPFDTCDADHDLPITDDVVTLIWAYGEIDDDIQYHFQNRGTYDAYLLDPDLTPRSVDPEYREMHPEIHDSPEMAVFRMSKSMSLPTQDTVYWCSFHRVPTITKHHIIGFGTQFPTDLDRRHVHHLLLHRCHAPDGVDPASIFESATRGEGSECYFLAEPNPLPTQYCRETIHVWAVGGRPIFFPEHTGLPMSESGNEYFVLQVHYDNPNLIPNLNITVELDAYYSEHVRDNDLGMYQLGEQIPGSTSIILPPSSLDHVIIGHCAPGCTERIIPEGGVSVIASFLHTHISGRGVRFLHHRGNQELSWISHDDNYNFNYQQFRILRQERRLLPGDLLMDRCVYDTTERNGSVVVGGFSTREEMCTGFLYYYPRSNGFALCRSEIRTESYRDLIGIQNTTWVESRRQMVITSPPQYAGLGIAEYAENYIDWNIQTRDEIQRHHKFDPQVSQCPRIDIQPNSLSQSVPESSPQLQLQLQRLYSKRGRFSGGNYGRDGYGIGGLLNEELQSEADDNPEFVSVNPRGIERFRRPAQCTRKDSRIIRTNDKYKSI